MAEGIRVLLADDEQLCIDSLRQMLRARADVQVVGEATTIDGCLSVLRQRRVDLVFLDIKMGGESGFDLAVYLHRNFPKTMLVFVTGFEGFALAGYDYEPLDFLAKPVQEERLDRVLDRAHRRMRQMGPSHDARIGIQFAGGMHFVRVGSIIVVERQGRNVRMVCDPEQPGGEPAVHVVRHSMSELEGMLVGYDFVRVHQSFIVPLWRITDLESSGIGSGRELSLEGWDQKIPVSRSKYREVQGLLQERGASLL